MGLFWLVTAYYMVYQGRYRIPITTAFLHINKSPSTSVGLFYHIPHIFCIPHAVPRVVRHDHHRSLFSYASIFFFCRYVSFGAFHIWRRVVPRAVSHFHRYCLCEYQNVSLHVNTSLCTAVGLFWHIPHTLLTFYCILQAIPIAVSHSHHPRLFSYQYAIFHMSGSLCTFRIGLFCTFCIGLFLRIPPYQGQYRIPITAASFHVHGFFPLGNIWLDTIYKYVTQALPRAVSHSHR